MLLIGERGDGLGARDQRIQAAAACAPVTDVVPFHGEKEINEAFPGFDGFFVPLHPLHMSRR